MKDLLTQYTIEQLILIIIALLAGLKSAVTFYDWAKKRLKEALIKPEQDKTILENRIKDDENKINELINMHKETEKNINELSKSVQILIDSDKDDIKSWITEQHHKFCYSKSRSIDTYSLDCIEKRYSHYKDEGGNSFIEALMNDIRNLSVYYPEKENKDNNEE